MQNMRIKYEHTKRKIKSTNSEKSSIFRKRRPCSIAPPKQTNMKSMQKNNGDINAKKNANLVNAHAYKINVIKFFRTCP